MTKLVLSHNIADALKVFDVRVSVLARGAVNSDDAAADAARMETLEPVLVYLPDSVALFTSILRSVFSSIDLSACLPIYISFCLSIDR